MTSVVVLVSDRVKRKIATIIPQAALAHAAAPLRAIEGARAQVLAAPRDQRHARVRRGSVTVRLGAGVRGRADAPLRHARALMDERTRAGAVCAIVLRHASADK